MMVLTFRDVSKFASVNPATEALISDGFAIDLLSFMAKLEDNQSVMNPNLVYLCRCTSCVESISPITWN